MLLKTLLCCLFLASAQTQDKGKETAQVSSCILDDGSIGECVPFYLCHTNKTINDVGINVIDIRAGEDDCVSYLDTCCLSDDKQETPITPKEESVMEQRQGCGFRNPEGVGFRTTGDVDGEAKFGEFPWMVAIIKVQPMDAVEPSESNMTMYQSGGSLIHPNVVLTAAHSVATDDTFKIRAGDWDARTTKEIYPHQDRDVIFKEIHQNFHPGTLFFDVALLFLKTPVDLRPNVGVVCLPPPKQITAAGTRCFATGWGKEKYDKESQYQTLLKKIDVPVVERSTCQRALRETRLGRHFKLHTSFMCAGGEKDKDVCRGDGGSPLSCPIELQKDRYIQSGIVAWGIGCGEEGNPGVYVNVAILRDWIDEKVIARGYDTKSYTY